MKGIPSEKELTTYCIKIDNCYKITMLKDKDWAGDWQFAQAVHQVCGRCGNRQIKLDSSNIAFTTDEGEWQINTDGSITLKPLWLDHPNSEGWWWFVWNNCKPTPMWYKIGEQMPKGKYQKIPEPQEER